MKDNKYILRFFASAMLVSMAYGGYTTVSQNLADAKQAEANRPLLTLTTGETVDPATAPEITKFVNATAKDFAETVFGDTDETPDLNKFLSIFTCSACGKRCLLTSPRCSKGKGSQEKAIVMYQEMYPDAEVLYVDGKAISLSL